MSRKFAHVVLDFECMDETYGCLEVSLKLRIETELQDWMWSGGRGGHVSDSRSYWYERLSTGQVPRPGKVDGH